MHVERQRYLRSNLKVTPLMVGLMFWIGWSAWMINFDLGYGATVLQMQAFQKSFGTCTMAPNPATGVMEEVCTLSAVAQSMVAISSLFMALGSLVSAIPGHFWGRKGTIWVGCCLIIIGAAAQCGTSGNYVAYNVCKCITTFGIGHLIAVAYIYGAEVAAPQRRGAIVAIISIGLTLGQLISAGTTAGTANFTTDWAWRLPIILQIPFAIIYAIGIVFFPESPRWLLLKGRQDQARRSFGRYYNKDPYSEEITAQIREVQTYIEFEKGMSSTSSWTEMFHRKYIRRTITATFVSMVQGLSGVTFVVNYFVVYLVATGVKNPFVVFIYLSICGLAGSCCGPFIVEFGGRRFAQVFGFGIMSACMLIFSAVASGIGATSTAAKNCLVAFLCIWFFTFAAFVSSNSWILSAEIHSVRLRACGQALALFAASLFNFATTFWTPYMINPTAGNMGTNVGYFYFGMDFAIFILLFLMIPETARLSLEQIDDYFVSGRKPWRTSLSRNKKIALGETFDIPPEAHAQAHQEAEATLVQASTSKVPLGAGV